MQDTEDLSAWLRLEQTPGVGLETARKLLQAFGLPANIFSASYSALIKCVSERIAMNLLAAPSTELVDLTNRTIEWANQPGNHVLTLADETYPKSLLTISDPPLILYAKGRVELLEQQSLAVVGSRNATAQGLSNAEQFSENLSASGFTIISGLALGIDASAHSGALKACKSKPSAGSTIAVIGTGADIVYPARNRGLAHQIALEGCILSEYALGTPAVAHNFPKRNRIISGLARGVLVVEAAAQSGSLITARMAAEQGREVFAIPGSIHSPLSKGCHLLIKQGAKLVETAQDILEELSPLAPTTHLHQESQVINIAVKTFDIPPAMQPAEDNRDPLTQALGYDPVDLDTLALRSGIGIESLQERLLDLELAGELQILPGGLVQRKG